MVEHISIEKLYDERMWIITLHQGNREGVDAWEQSVRDYIAEFQNAPERYLVYDTTLIRNLGFTRYLQERATVLAKDNPEATGRVALVLNIPAVIASFFDMFIRVIGSRIQPHLDVKIFSKRDDAVAWVSAIVPSGVEA